MKILITAFLSMAISCFPQALTLREPSFLAVATAPASGGWSLPVAGYTLWLTPQDSSTMFTNGIGTVATVAGATDQARVGKWMDKSDGGTNHVYEYGNLTGVDTRPILTNSAIFNNQPIMNFYVPNYAQAGLISSNTTSLGSSNSGSCTAFVVCRFMPVVNGNGDYGTPFSFNDFTAGPGTGFIGFRRNVNAQQMTAFDCVAGAFVPTVIGTNLAMVYGLRFSNSIDSLQIWTNLGLAATSVSTGCILPGSGGRANVGTLYIANGSRFNSEMADVIYYPFELTNTEMTNMLQALKTKYIP